MCGTGVGCNTAPSPTCCALQVKIAEAGAVPLLVGLLRSPKDATRKAAASGGWPIQGQRRERVIWVT